MTVSNRAKAIIAGVLVLIALILIIIFLPRPGAEPAPEPTVTPTELPVTDTTPKTPTPEPEPTITPERQQEVSLSTVGKIFVERYGSYSSESDLANIEDILPLATTRYQTELENFIEDSRAGGSATTYYGVSTRVLSVEVTESTAGTATLTVLTQREESRGSVQDASIRYQSIVLELVKTGDTWLVDSAIWQ